MNAKIAMAALVTAGLVVSGSAAANAAVDGDKKIKLRSDLTAEQVFPGPGDQGARAQFKAEIRGDTLCYTLKVKKLDGATDAHIHFGAAGTVGPIVVQLEEGKKGSYAGCLTAVPDAEDTDQTLSESELAAIKADRSLFYVDVHSEEFLEGAVRGQLR